MKTTMIGTILPTLDSLQKDDAWYRQDQQARTARANADPLLSQCDKRTEKGEVRYYLSETVFAVVGRNLTPRWFEIRGDGEYAIAAPTPIF